MKYIKKLLIFVLIIVITLPLLSVFIFILRYVNPSFRYIWDVNFMPTSYHESYNTTKETMIHLKLPESTAYAYRHSDKAVTYITKLNNDEFFNFYESMNYTIGSNTIQVDEGIFKITYSNYKMGYYLVDIELIVSSD